MDFICQISLDWFYFARSPRARGRHRKFRRYIPLTTTDRDTKPVSIRAIFERKASTAFHCPAVTTAAVSTRITVLRDFLIHRVTKSSTTCGCRPRQPTRWRRPCLTMWSGLSWNSARSGPSRPAFKCKYRLEGRLTEFFKDVVHRMGAGQHRHRERSSDATARGWIGAEGTKTEPSPCREARSHASGSSMPSACSSSREAWSPSSTRRSRSPSRRAEAGKGRARPGQGEGQGQR